MKLVYSACASAEAHMISHMLDQEGIKNQVLGDYLQGAIGEVPPTGHIKVWIENEADYDEALKLIGNWKKIQATPLEENSTYSQNQKNINKPGHIAISFLIGLILGSGFFYWHYNSPVSHNGIDYNQDGKLDLRYTYKNNRISLVELDQNLDGKIDLIERYNSHGLLHISELDSNFDGIFETKTTYRQGNPIRTEEKSFKKGYPSFITEYIDGALLKSRLSMIKASSQ